MICAFSEGRSYPCGQCTPCRVNRQRKWLCRLLCESCLHPSTPLFVTLTYRESPKCLVDGNLRETLRPDDVTNWIKRLRRRVSGTSSGLTSANPELSAVRYYLCGEYGTKSGRPHYHAILFGATDLILPLLEKTWSHGFVTVRLADAVNMSYTLKYVLKGIGEAEDETSPLVPQFSRMSLRPPLGTGYAKNIAKAFMPLMARDNSPAMEDFLGRLPPVLNIAGKTLPLDRTMKKAVASAMVDEGLPGDLIDLVFPTQEYLHDAEAVKKAQGAHHKAWRNRKRTTQHAV